MADYGLRNFIKILHLQGNVKKISLTFLHIVIFHLQTSMNFTSKFTNGHNTPKILVASNAQRLDGHFEPQNIKIRDHQLENSKRIVMVIIKQLQNVGQTF